MSNGPASGPSIRPGDDVLRLKRVTVKSEAGAPEPHLGMGDAFIVEIDFWALASGRKTHLTFHLINEQGIVVLTTGSPPQIYVPGLHRAVCHFPANLLNSGDYTLKLLIVENENIVAYVHEAAGRFNIADASRRDYAYLGREPGVVQPLLVWQTTSIDVETAPSVITDERNLLHESMN